MEQQLKLPTGKARKRRKEEESEKGQAVCVCFKGGMSQTKRENREVPLLRKEHPIKSRARPFEIKKLRDLDLNCRMSQIFLTAQPKGRTKEGNEPSPSRST